MSRQSHVKFSYKQAFVEGILRIQTQTCHKVHGGKFKRAEGRKQPTQATGKFAYALCVLLRSRCAALSALLGIRDQHARMC